MQLFNHESSTCTSLKKFSIQATVIKCERSRQYFKTAFLFYIYSTCSPLNFCCYLPIPKGIKKYEKFIKHKLKFVISHSKVTFTKCLYFGAEGEERMLLQLFRVEPMVSSKQSSQFSMKLKCNILFAKKIC